MTENETCPKCGSTRIMPEVRVFAQYSANPKSDLFVEAYERPDALIFKHAQRGTVKARVCADCGHTELFVTNPQELWAAHQKAQMGDEVD